MVQVYTFHIGSVLGVAATALGLRIGIGSGKSGRVLEFPFNPAFVEKLHVSVLG